MRMRKKKHGAERIEACSHLLITPDEAFKANPQSAFTEKKPIHLEIGCGKGGFISQLAALNPDINYIAMEKCTDVIIMAMEKVMALGLKNVYFINDDAAQLTEILEKGEVSRIYINFCDPWRKSHHKKRRLTHSNFLNIYKAILPSGGEVHFKTDNRKLFEFSLNEFAGFDVKMRNICLDLHNSDFEGNIMTEYEKNFSEKGFPIFRCELVF